MAGNRRIWLRVVGVGAVAAASVLLIAGCGRETITGDGVAATSGSTGLSTDAETTDMTQSSSAGTPESEASTEFATGGGSTESEASTVTDSETSTGAAACATSATWAKDEQAKQLSVSNGFVTSVAGEASDCADRIVIGIGQAKVAPGYLVTYVPEVQQDASGLPVPLRGAAFLQVVVDAPSYDIDASAPTLTAANDAELLNPAEFAVVRQMSSAGSFEGQSTFGIGLDSARPFLVSSTIDADGRAELVIEIARG